MKPEGDPELPDDGLPDEVEDDDDDLGTAQSNLSVSPEPTTGSVPSLEEIGARPVPCQPADVLRMRQESLE